MDKARRRVPPPVSARRRLAAAGRQVLRRASSSLGGGRPGLLRALLLLLVLCVAALTLRRVPLSPDGEASSVAVLAPQLRASRRPQVVRLDGRAVGRPLPAAYPNGERSRFTCDLPALRFQCELDGRTGCRAYPQLFPAADILRNWSPDDPEHPPVALFSSVCRFDVSDPVRSPGAFDGKEGSGGTDEVVDAVRVPAGAALPRHGGALHRVRGPRADRCGPPVDGRGASWRTGTGCGECRPAD